MEAPPPLIESPPERAPQPRMSLAARLLNVFAIPGQVFAELKRSPSAVSNWLVPALLGAVMGVALALIILSQPAIQQRFRDRQTKLMEEASKAGKLTPEQQALFERLKSPQVLKGLGSAAAVVGSFGNVFWWGLVLWFLARTLFRTKVPFHKTLEVAGLAMMINLLGGIVAMLLIVNFGRAGATPSLALLVKDFDSTRKGHLFAAAANIFSVWVVGVRSIGLAKLAGVPYLRAAWAVFTFWVMEQSFLILSGLGQLAM